jgi:hypothetical protein
MSKMMTLVAALLSVPLLISCGHVAPRIEIDRAALELDPKPTLPSGSNRSVAAYLIAAEEWMEAADGTHDATLDVLCELAECIVN